MIKTVYTNRTMDQLVELARRQAPKLSDELMVLLREVVGDMEELQEQLEQPPHKADAGQVIADLWVDSNTLARKGRQLAEVLDKLLRQIPDDAQFPVVQEATNRTRKKRAA